MLCIKQIISSEKRNGIRFKKKRCEQYWPYNRITDSYSFSICQVFVLDGKYHFSAHIHWLVKKQYFKSHCSVQPQLKFNNFYGNRKPCWCYIFTKIFFFLAWKMKGKYKLYFIFNLQSYKHIRSRYLTNNHLYFFASILITEWTFVY